MGDPLTNGAIMPSIDLNEETNVVIGYDSPLSIMRILIFVIGMVGNLLVIFVLLVLREYRKTITHWCVSKSSQSITEWLVAPVIKSYCTASWVTLDR